MVSHICRQMLVKGPFSDMHTRSDICVELPVKGLSRMSSKGLFRVNDIWMIGNCSPIWMSPVKGLSHIVKGLLLRVSHIYSSPIWMSPSDIRVGPLVKGLSRIDSKGLFHMNGIWMLRVSYMWEKHEHIYEKHVSTIHEWKYVYAGDLSYRQ